jgi:hypothetical protein
MKKIINIVLIVLVAVGIVSVLYWMFSGNNLENVDFMLRVGYVYLILAVVALIGLTAMNMGKSKGGNGMLNAIVFGGLAILAVILWFAFAKDVPVRAADGVTVYSDTFTLKATDTGLYLTYLALAITVLTLLWGVVRKALK